jgi:hypothetical protein
MKNIYVATLVVIGILFIASLVGFISLLNSDNKHLDFPSIHLNMEQKELNYDLWQFYKNFA